MGAAEFVRAERLALCDLLERRGADAPTLCAGWSTRDLAAHLVVRETRPDAALGIVVGPARGWLDRVQQGAAARPFPDLVSSLRSGPPTLSPFRLPMVAGIVDVLEFFVHHEDVRRVGDWQPRELSEQDRDLLWSHLRRGARGLFRRSPVGVVLDRTDGPDGRIRAKPGDPFATVSGPAPELVMFAFGRRGATLAQVTGEPPVVEALAASSLSV